MPVIDDRAPLLSNGHNKDEPLLVVDGLCAPKLGGLSLWSDVSFTVSRGQVLALRGPTGVGKSVLLKCIANLLVHRSPVDALRLDGRPPSKMPDWRRDVLYVPQRPSMLPGTPADFLSAAQSFRTRRKTALMSRDELLDLTAEWHLSERSWDQPWLTLSGGEAQRIALLIAISLESRVLLLDEPTSALDEATCLIIEKRILSLLRENGMGCIWITHSDAQCDRVADTVYRLHPQLEVRRSSSICRAQLCPTQSRNSEYLQSVATYRKDWAEHIAKRLRDPATDTALEPATAQDMRRDEPCVSVEQLMPSPGLWGQASTRPLHALRIAVKAEARHAGPFVLF